MRIFLLSLLAATALLACNRDASEATTSDDGGFLAPASAPVMPERQNIPDEERPLEAMPMPEESMENAVNKAGRPLTPEEQEAAAKKIGPGHHAGIPKREAPVTAAAPTATPVPAKPAPMAPPDATKKPALDYGRPLVTLRKSPCYGGENCRQFVIVLTADRRLVLEPKRNMDRKGTYTRLLSAREYNELTDALNALEVPDMPATYPADATLIPADVQASVLDFADVYGEPKRVEVYADAPAKLAAFLSAMEAWVDKDGWIKSAQ